MHFKFMEASGKDVLREFGVIAHAPEDAAKRWARDLTEYFERNHIGYALWNYKCLDFGRLI